MFAAQNGSPLATHRRGAIFGGSWFPPIVVVYAVLFALLLVGAPCGAIALYACAALAATVCSMILTVADARGKRRLFDAISESYDDELLTRLPNKDAYDYAISLIKDNRRSSEDDAYFRLFQKQAELGVMQNQINPHFLYNTLECIRGLALEQGADETANMAELLSKLFRYYVSSGNDLQPIQNELISVDNYMKIQQYRFHNRYTLDCEVDYQDEGIMGYKIPKLTLQPIIENSIRHAFNTKPADNRILIEIYTSFDRLTISISDNGDGMNEEQLNRLNERLAAQTPQNTDNCEESHGSGTGIALSNVNTRIQMIFGRQYGLTAFSSLGLGTQIKIDLPYKENKNA